MNNLELYRTLATMFCNEFLDFEQRFLTALQDEEPANATLIAHTLKGNAGNLGAIKLPKLAQRLEMLCNESGSTEDILSALQDVLAELKPMIASLGHFIAKTADE